METVELKNGSVEAKPLVVAAMMSLDLLWKKGIPGVCAVYDLYERCQNPEHPIAQSEMKLLTDLALVDADGRIHDSMRNIVLSACTGKGFDMKMGSPVKQ